MSAEITPHKDPVVESAIARMIEDEARARQSAELVDDDLVPLEELDDEDLEAVVRMASSGGNELMQQEGREAAAILKSRRAS